MSERTGTLQVLSVVSGKAAVVVDLRVELAQVENQLHNIRALFAIFALVALGSLIVGVSRSSVFFQAAAGAVGVLGLGWCVNRQYRLMRSRDRLTRALLQAGVEQVLAKSRVRIESRISAGAHAVDTSEVSA